MQAKSRFCVLYLLLHHAALIISVLLEPVVPQTTVHLSLIIPAADGSTPSSIVDFRES